MSHRKGQSPRPQTSANTSHKRSLYHPKTIHNQWIFTEILPTHQKPEIKSARFSKMKPKVIQKDKERLFQDNLHLKSQLNNVNDQLMKLKAKMRALQKKKQKDQKTFEKSKIIHQKLFNSVQESNYESILRQNNINTMIQELRHYKEKLEKQNKEMKGKLAFSSKKQMQIQINLLQNENKKLHLALQEHEKQVNGLNDTLRKKKEQRKNMRQQMEELNKKLMISEESKKQILRTMQLKVQIVRKEKQQQARIHNESIRQMGIKMRELAQKIENQKKDIKLRQDELQKMKKEMTQVQKMNDKVEENNRFLESELQKERQKNILLIQQQRQLQAQLQQMKINYELLQKHNNVSKIQINQNMKGQKSYKLVNFIHQAIQTSQQKCKCIIDGFSQTQFAEVLHQKPEINIEELKKSIHHLEICTNMLSFQYKCAIKKEVKNIQTSYCVSQITLKNLKILINYRLKAFNYSFALMKKDIENANIAIFDMKTIISMMIKKPFLLNSKQILVIFQLLTDSQFPQPHKTLTKIEFVNKISLIFNEQELINFEPTTQTKKQIMQKILPSLDIQFYKTAQILQNQNRTISLLNIRKLLNNLPPKYIQILISELCIFSEDLQNLEYRKIFTKSLLTE